MLHRREQADVGELSARMQHLGIQVSRMWWLLSFLLHWPWAICAKPRVDPCAHMSMLMPVQVMKPDQILT